MGHSQAEKAATHQRIVDVAARRFRELGLDGIGVADVMKEAGMTVGGFYKHFASRDELVTEALEVAFKSLDVWEARAENLAQAVRDYLSEAHRDAPGKGCALGALLGDVGRSNDATREVFTERVKHNLAFSEGLLDIADPAERRARAMLQMSACLGAIGLARAVSDPVLSKEILDGVAGQLMPLLPGPRS
jgi:TetR/AcrR family transcriptional regulator, transcriptional repressor for nem operon